ncbi:MAG TPA: hypothetical protein VMQ73_10775 [Methylomirabilota bacterium]|nr:hypothetical protein [Methylomirabilota bacterium]
MMRGAIASVLLGALSAACASSTDLQPSLRAAADQLRADEAACAAPQRPTTAATALCQEHAERKAFAEHAPYLVAAAEAFSAKRLTAAQWLDRENDASTAATRRFDQAVATTLKDLKTREPLLNDPLSPLSLRIMAAKPLDACGDNGIAVERVRCISDLVAPIWSQEARDTVDDFNAAARTILTAATELDTTKAPQIRKQNASRYADMLAQPQADLARDIRAAIGGAQQRLARRAPADAAQLSSGLEQSAADIVAAISDTTIAAAPGYMAATAPHRDPPSIRCGLKTKVLASTEDCY